ncbi:hypothetical protein K5D39_11190 [Pseudomonas cichorii]|nr:hypothetical protein [Pseudomonas cichorii]
MDGSHNGFPNKHLTHKQIQRSLDVQGLRYHSTTITTQTQKWFHSYASTHVDSDLPIILAGVVYGPENATAADKQIREADALEALEEMEGLDEAAREELKNEMKTSTGQPMCLKGGHAVTLVGYDFRDGKEWLYVHDDRLGPYARAKIAPAEEFIEAQADIGSVASDEVRELLSDRWAFSGTKRNRPGCRRTKSWYQISVSSRLTKRPVSTSNTRMALQQSFKTN